MALIVNNGASGATGSVVVAKDRNFVAVSGLFDGATVEIFVRDNTVGARPAVVTSFRSPGAMELPIGNGGEVSAVVNSGGASVDVDVSVT